MIVSLSLLGKKKLATVFGHLGECCVQVLSCCPLLVLHLVRSLNAAQPVVRLQLVLLLFSWCVHAAFLLSSFCPLLSSSWSCCCPAAVVPFTLLLSDAGAGAAAAHHNNNSSCRLSCLGSVYLCGNQGTGQGKDYIERQNFADRKSPKLFRGRTGCVELYPGRPTPAARPRPSGHALGRSGRGHLPLAARTRGPGRRHGAAQREEDPNQGEPVTSLKVFSLVDALQALWNVIIR